MRVLPLLLIASALPGLEARAQTIFRDDERLASDRPEAWAMNYFAASTFMTAFGQTPVLAPGRWDIALELGHIPGLSETQRRVGFGGFKTEDLNKSPVFGRWRLQLGLPAGWVAELGHTPPLAIGGVRPRDLVALAVGRRVFARGNYTLSARAFAQHGQVRGDITCPVDLAGVVDSEQNPYGCQAASSDRVALNHYGIELTSGWGSGTWRWHAGLGATRTETEVQVDALTYDVRDLSRLTARDALPFFTLGSSRELGARWHLGVEILHVPLTVKRGEGPSEHEPLTSLRLQLRYRHN